MAEQFALEQILWDRVAIDRGERTVLSRTAPMDRQRRHFLAGAALAQEQNGRARARDFTDKGEDALHLRAGAKHVFKSVHPHVLLHFAILALEISQVDTTP